MSLSISSSKIRKFIAGFFLFILFLLLFDRGLFYLISNLEANFYQGNDFEKRFERFVKDAHFTTLIFGTSRTYEGIHPYYIEEKLNQKAFKESYVGKGPKYNYYFYKLYKKYAGIPKVVIYGVDYFIYAVGSDPKWMSRFDINTGDEKIDYLSNPLLLVKYKKKIDNFLNNILIRLKVEMGPKISKESLQDFIDIQNYTGLMVKNKKLVTEPYKNYKRQVYIRSPGKEGDYFKKLLDELERDQVTVILVALPDYFGSFKTNLHRHNFVLHLRELKHKYKNLFFYNYNRPRKFPLNNTEYFNDGGYGETNSHLSQKGAKVFNERLVKDIKKHYQ